MQGAPTSRRIRRVSVPLSSTYSAAPPRISTTYLHRVSTTPCYLPQVYQQLLKLLFLKVVPQARPNALIMDADVFWLRDVEFIDRKGRLL